MFLPSYYHQNIHHHPTCPGNCQKGGDTTKRIWSIHLSKKATNHLLPSWPYDHPINLDKSFIPKVKKVYPLTPEEQKVTEDFLEETLNPERFDPQIQASSLFFVGKNNNGLWPCKDHRYVNEHTIKDAYPLPLISDKVKVPRSLPSLMFAGDTTTSEWKSVESHMIAKGWFVVYMDDLLISSPNKDPWYWTHKKSDCVNPTSCGGHTRWECQMQKTLPLLTCEQGLLPKMK